MPEIVATLAEDGAELIAIPTCWVNTARTPGQYENPQVSFLIEARAVENRVFVAGANDRSAIIIGPDGSVLAQSCGDDPTGAVVEIDLAQASDKCVAPATDVFDDRHVAHYRF